MFRDLGRVHIVSFAVGIVGLIIGIVGIVLAIVFGTASTTCSTPATPTCPPVTTLPCATNLFGISTTVNNMKYDKAYNNVGGPEWQAAVDNITTSLKNTLNTGLNTPSASSFLRILVATGPTSNNVEVKITSLVPDKNGLVIAIGNGAVSSAVPQGAMPNATNVANVISSDPTSYSNSTATPEVCQPTCQESQPCTTQAPNCPVCTTPAVVQSTTVPVLTSTVPVVTTTQNGQTSSPSKTTTRVQTSTPLKTTAGIQTSSSAAVVTTTKAATSTESQVSTSTAPSTSANIGTSKTTKGSSTPGISSTAAITTTRGTVTTTTATTSTQTPSTSSLATKSTQKVSSTPAPAPSSTQSQPTSTGSTSASPTPPTSPTTPAPSTPSAQSTSTAPLPSSTATTIPTTTGSNECYYQSNIAVAVELTDPSSPIDLKMQNFIANNLLFYPGNKYQLGKPGSGMTQLALVPYPTFTDIEDIMGYGVATSSQRITGLFYSLGIFAGPDPEIYEALDFIGNITHEGGPGYVIIVGNNGTSITNSMSSSVYLQQLGFKIITIGYQSTDDFSVLASNAGFSFKISQDSDELAVAQQIGTILYIDYCLNTSTVAPKTTTPPAVVTSPSTRVPSSSAAPSSQPPVTTTIVTSTTAKAPLSSTSIRPAPSSSMGTSSTSPGTSTLQQEVSSTSATLPTTKGILSSTMNPTTSTQAPSSSSLRPSTRIPSTMTSTTTQNLPSSSLSPSPIPTTTNKFSTSTQYLPSTSSSSSPAPSTSQPSGTSTQSSPQTSSSNPSTSTQSVTSQPTPTSTGSPSTSSQPTTSIPSPNPSTYSTQSTSNGPLTSSSSQLTSTTLPVQSSAGSTASSAPSTVPPTKPPNVCYYQSNVAVAFELSTSADDIDLQIQDFITNDLFFYENAPYDLGHPSDNKTELSLVPYPNEESIHNLMAYGSATTPGDIKTLMETFQVLGMGDSSIADAFNIIPKNQRIGEPGFVILVANSAVTVQASVDSATQLKALGFNIITVAFKSAGSFSVLSSDPSYNFQIHQDVDRHSVALAIGNILYAIKCTSVASTTVGSTVSPAAQSTTVTVPQGPTSSPARTSTVPNASSTSTFRSSSTVSYTTTTAGPTPTTCVCTTVEPGSTSPGYSTSTYATTIGSSSYSTPRVTSGSTPVSSQGTTPGASSSSPSQKSTVVTSPSAPTQSTETPGPSSSSPAQQTSTPAMPSSSQTSTPGASTSVTTPGGSSTPAPLSTSPSMSSSVTGPSTLPPTSGPTTSQICPNQQTVFNGQVGVVFELLPVSTQQAVINDFVENILLNSNFYGLAVDNLNGANRTLATAIPYPSTDKYVVGGYGSARSVNDFRNQVVAFNAVIPPVSSTSDIDDALLYITTNLPAGGVKSALIIVGNNGSMIGVPSSVLADGLKKSFDIYTVAVGDNPAANQLASLSSGDGFNFIGSTQQIADQIGLKMATSNPAIYCPPPVPSTIAPITSTIRMSSVSTVTPTVAPTTTVTTGRPTVGPCQCTGRWVYNGDLSIAFEYVKNSQGSDNVTNFVRNTLLSNPDAYGLSNDLNGNQPSKITIIPYPDTNNYPIYPYGSIQMPSGIGGIIDAYSNIKTDKKDPAISDAFVEISTLKNDSYAKVVLLVASDGSDVAAAADSAQTLKKAGYTIITVAQSVSADVFRPLASADKYALKIGDGNDNDVATQIANLLLDISFVCYDDGSSTPSPITRCPTTQGPTQSGTTGTTPASVASSSTVGSTPGSSTAGNSASTSVPVPSTQGSSTASPSASSSTMGTTVSVASTVTTPQVSTSQTSGSSSSMGSTISQGSTATQPSTVPSSVASTGSTAIGSTVTSGSSTQGPSTSVGSTVTGSSSTAGSSVSSGSTTTGPSTMVNTGSTTAGSTVTQGSSTFTMTQSTGSPTTSLPSCPSPYKGKIAAVFELNAVQPEIQDVVNFLSNNLYNSANYDFTSDTQAVNVPYPNTDSSSGTIGKYGDFTSLAALQENIDALYNVAGFSTDADIADGLNYMLSNNLSAGGSKAVIIVVGHQEDDNYGLTYQALQTLKSQGYQIMSVAVGAGHGSLLQIADKPEWYFQVDDSNGQFVANQISSILCNL